MSIIQGAQYYVPMKFKQGDVYFTPSNCDDIKVKFGDTTVTKSGGTLTWDSTNSQWQMWLSQEQSLALRYGGKALAMQAEIKVGNNILPTELMHDAVGHNIIKEVFDDE